MRKHLSSIIKLLISLGIGVLIIWLAYRNISKPQEITYPRFETGHELSFLVGDSVYVEEGDTLAYISYKDADGYSCVATTEGIFRHAEDKESTKDGEQGIAGTIQVKLVHILKKELKGAKHSWLVICMIVSLLSHLPRILRWQLMLEPLAGRVPRLGTTAVAVYITYLANLAFPRLGEITRCGIISRYERIPFNQVVGTMITERAIDVICLLLFGVITLLTQFEVIFRFFKERVIEPATQNGLSPVLIIVAVVLLLGLVLILLFLRRNVQSGFLLRIQELLRGVVNGVKSVRKVRNVPLFLFYTVLMWFMYFIMIYICFQAFPESRSLSLGAGLSCFFFGSISLIIVQGGIGAYPLAIKEVLLLYGISAAQGYAFGWVIWIAITLVVLIAGAGAILGLSLIKKNNPQA